MKIETIVNANRGARFLMLCNPHSRDEILEGISGALPPSLKDRTELNTCSTIMMDMNGDAQPNAFSDLSALCAKLIISAGRRSHFEGLLTLDITGLKDTQRNAARLRALGELLALKKGLASQCVTLIHLSASEEELFNCAACLDFDGKLRVGCYEECAMNITLDELLMKTNMRCDTRETKELLNNALRKTANSKCFSLSKCLGALGEYGGIITRRSVQALLDDKYSYLNRFLRDNTHLIDGASARRIGFSEH